MTIKNLVTWVHTCPQRQQKLDRLIDSLENSDLEQWQICSAGDGNTPLSWPKTIDWWIAHWEKMASIGDWVLRIEDDVIVSPHIFHNLTTWPAINEPDFGVGLGFIFDFLIQSLGGVAFLPNKVLRAKGKSFAGGQAQLMPSSVIAKVVSQLRDWQNDERYTSHLDATWLDTVLTEAVTNLGYTIYLHAPSVVQTCELSLQSAASLCPRPSHAATKTWDPTWKRPEDYAEEFLCEMMVRGTRTRWAVLDDGVRKTVMRCSTPRNLGVDVTPVTINGRLCPMRNGSLFDSEREATKSAGCKP